MKKFVLITVMFLLSGGRIDAVGLTASKTRIVQAPSQTRTTLRVQADLYFGAEDDEVEPVEADFYLLDESLLDILRRIKLKPVFADGIRHRPAPEDYLEAAAKVILSESSDDEVRLLAHLIGEALERHQSSFVRTKQSGRGYFREIKAGNYYLFGVKKIEDQVVVWHLPVCVRSGSNSIDLDQNNAATVFLDE